MKKTLIAVVILLLALAACDSLPLATIDDETTITQEQQTSQTDAVAQTDTEMADEETMNDTTVVEEPTSVEVVEDIVVEEEPVVVEVVEDPTPQPQTVAYNAPSWANLQITDANTGETFTLADYAGRTVFIEPMATWCTNCLAQQRRVAAAMAQLNTDDVVFISLSVEPISDDRLAAYSQQNAFPQQFVVGTPDLINALVEQFGRTIVSPPSTPHFIIAPDGSLSPLYRGSHRDIDIIEQVQTYSGQAS